MGGFLSTPIHIESPLPMNEVSQRIQTAAGGLSGLWSAGESPFRGFVQGDSCQLIAVGGGRDLQKCELRLKFIEKDAAATNIEGEFALRTSTSVVAILWFGFVVTFLTAAFVARVHGDHSDGSTELLFVPAGMLIFGIVLSFGLFFLGRWHERAMIRYLETLLDARSI
jgi:hypothetical protein